MSNFNRPVPAPPLKSSVKPKELKVEDALHYLDQVKMEFSDKPTIYNEFLEIMKSFKAESINTPGVIARVKDLFRGYNKLILGFNTFLPEGEGYKIELTAEEEASAFPGHQMTVSIPPAGAGTVGDGLVTPTGKPDEQPALPSASNPDEPAPSVPIVATTDVTVSVSGANPAAIGTTDGSTAESKEAPASGAAGPVTAPPAGTTPAATVPTNQQGLTAQQLQQQHAIIYVTTIRNRFHNEPDTYRSFLKILHTYQKEQRGIKDVLEQVSQLFADHSDLLMEFTYFLPDAVQDQAKERLQRAVKESELRAKMTANGQRPPPHLLPGAGNMFPPGTPGSRPPLHSTAPTKGTGNKRSRNNQNSIPAGATRLPNASVGGHPSSPYMMNANKAMMNGSGEVYYPMGYPGPGQPPRGGMLDPRAMHIAGGRGAGARRPPMGYPGPGPISGHRPNFAPGGVGPNGHRGQDMVPQKKEVTVAAPYHTLSAEKRFFDQVKKVLSGVSKNAWNEFVKCMELCCAEIITPKEMLDLSQGIFGSTAADLFEELRIIMTNKYTYDASISAQDSWYGVPLSEIDFSQSRKCTPSYRQLPGQYAKVLCSERAQIADSITFNDDWISIPIGSEDSCTFKHMRKNQYEEALFRAEDERFEMDMMIDANLCTIRVLEPMVREINHWHEARKEAQDEKSEANVNGDKVPKPEVLVKKFPFQIEKKNLTTTHLNCISRIYGKHGNEILELLYTNPVGTIPIVLDRLKQKDLEWRKSRQDLCPSWKEMIGKNHSKSLDHRSFYFKQQDKRFYSARNLVADLKVSDVHLSVPCPTTQQINRQDELLKQPGITFAVPVETMPQLAGKSEDMIPGLCMSYPHSAHGIHKDIYQILTHATESSNITPYAKDRITSLWRDLWRVFFNIPIQYIYDKAVIEDRSGATVPATHVGWEKDTKVITIYGSGSIISYDDEKKMYTVRLRASPEDPKEVSVEAVLGAEELSGGALQAIGVSRTPGAPAGTEDNISHMMPLRDLIAEHEKATFAASHNPEEAGQSYSAAECLASGKALDEGSQLFFGTQMCYVFLRLHQALYNRLQIARDLAATAHSNNFIMRQRSGSTISIYDETLMSPHSCRSSFGSRRNSTASATDFDIAGGSPRSKGPSPDKLGGDEGHKSGAGASEAANNVYSSFLSKVNAIVDGSTDHTKYEEATRQLLGNNSYVVFTIDKIIQQTVKCLNVMAMDETVMKLVGLFVYHRSLSGGVVPKVYQAHVAQILVNSNEEVYRLQCLSTHKPSNDHDSTGCCDQFDEEKPPSGQCSDNSVVACAILGHLHVPESIVSLLSGEHEDEGTGKAAVWFSGEGGAGSPRAGGTSSSPAVNAVGAAPDRHFSDVGTPRGAPAPLMLDDAEEEEDEEHDTSIVLAGGISSVQKGTNSPPSNEEEDSNEADSQDEDDEDEEESEVEDEDDEAAAIELLQGITGIGTAETESTDESELVIELPQDSTLKGQRGMGPLGLFTNPAASQPSEDDMEVEEEEADEGEAASSTSTSPKECMEAVTADAGKKRSSRPTRLSR